MIRSVTFSISDSHQRSLHTSGYCNLMVDGVGPEHSFLKDIGRAKYASATDKEALNAFKIVCRIEGIVPALESSHALAYLLKKNSLKEYAARSKSKRPLVLFCLSGRGDKDLDIVLPTPGGEK